MKKEKEILKLTPEEAEDYFGGECYKVGRRVFHRKGCKHRYLIRRISVPRNLEEYKLITIRKLAEKVWPQYRIHLIKRDVHYSTWLDSLVWQHNLPHNYIRPGA